MLQLVQAVGRFVLPVIALILLLRCVLSLLNNRPRVKTMAILVNGANGDRIPVDHWETSIGRSKSCDVMLGYSTVSRFHAVLSRRKNGWMVTDTGSRTGTYVNAQKILGETPVYDGDSIVFGNAVLFFAAPQADRPEGRAIQVDTQFYPEPAQDMADFEEPVPPARPLRAAHTGHTPALVPPEGEPYYLVKPDYTVGRAPDCDIVLSAPAVSRSHAMLSHTEEGWVLSDMGSRSGTFINDRQIVRAQLLYDGDSIRAGGVELTYYEDYDDFRPGGFHPRIDFPV